MGKARLHLIDDVGHADEEGHVVVRAPVACVRGRGGGELAEISGWVTVARLTAGAGERLVSRLAAGGIDALCRVDGTGHVVVRVRSAAAALAADLMAGGGGELGVGRRRGRQNARIGAVHG